MGTKIVILKQNSVYCEQKTEKHNGEKKPINKHLHVSYLAVMRPFFSEIKPKGTHLPRCPSLQYQFLKTAPQKRGVA